MTKALAPSYQALLLTTGLNLSSLNIKIVALDATYTYSSAHDYLNDVTSGARVATTANLASKTTTNGYFDAADPSLGSPAAGKTITQFWVYRDSGTESTSELIYYFNEDASGAAISVATNGAAITLALAALGLFRV